MQNLTPLEVVTLAHWYALCSRTISNAASSPVFNLGQSNALTALSNAIATCSSNLATEAVQVMFEDADKSFREISDAASQANADAKALATDVANLDRLLTLGGNLVTLGSAFLTGKYGDALKALIAIIGKPTPGQGAKDPLGS